MTTQLQKLIVLWLLAALLMVWAAPGATPIPTSISPKTDNPLPLLELVAYVESAPVLEGDPLGVTCRLLSPQLIDALAVAEEAGTSTHPATIYPRVAADWFSHLTVALERVEQGGNKVVIPSAAVSRFQLPAADSPPGPPQARLRFVLSPEAVKLTTGTYVLTLTCPTDSIGEAANGLTPDLTSSVEFDVVPATDPEQTAQHVGRLARLAHQRKDFAAAAKLSHQSMACATMAGADGIEQYLILTDSLVGLGKFEDAMAAYDEWIGSAGENEDVRHIAEERKAMLEKLMAGKVKPSEAVDP